jgi:hypothetical protein
MAETININDSYLKNAAKKLISDEVIDETYINDQSNINEKRLIREAISVYPVGGYGSKMDIIKKFEKKYRKNPIEHLLITNKMEDKFKIIKGDNEQVVISSDTRSFILSLKDGITVHNHPPNYEDEINFTGRQTEIYGSFSLDDILTFIDDRIVEDRVVDAKYTYVMQEPKIGWDNWLEIYSNYKTDISEYRKQKKEEIQEKIESIFNTYKLNEDEYAQSDWIHGESTHGANLEVSKKFKIPYARYLLT